LDFFSVVELLVQHPAFPRNVENQLPGDAFREL